MGRRCFTTVLVRRAAQAPPLRKLGTLVVSLVMLAGCSPSVDFRMRMWETFTTNAEHALANGDGSAARTMFEAALKQTTAMDPLDPRLIRTLVEVGMSRSQGGDNNGAIKAFEDAIDRCNRTVAAMTGPETGPILRMKGRALCGIGDCKRSNNDIPGAEKYYQDAIRSFEESHMPLSHGYDVYGVPYANALAGMGDVYAQAGKRDQALQMYVSANRIANNTAGALQLKWSLKTKLRHALWSTGCIEDAMQMESPLWADCIHDGNTALSQNNLADAILHFQDALDFAQNGVGDEYTQAATMWFLAQAQQKNGHMEEAAKLCSDGLRLQRHDVPFNNDFLTEKLWSTEQNPPVQKEAPKPTT